MNEQLKNAYTKLINKHFSAVQTEAALEYRDSPSMEKRVQGFWKQFQQAETEFMALLEKCTL